MATSYGEVSLFEMYDFETKAPVIGGLYCPMIFGVLGNVSVPRIGQGKDMQRYLECNVDDLFMRCRFGHIQLAVPVVHT